MLTRVSDAEDIDNVTSIIALISALEHGEPLRRALAQVGLTMATFQALNNQLCSRMGDEPDLAAAYRARLEAHQKALMAAALGAGRDAADLDVARDWNTVMRIEERAAEARREGERSMIFQRRRELSLAELREQIETRLQNPENAPEGYLASASLVWVDWRDDAADVIGYFAGYFPEGELRVSGSEIVAVRFRGRRATMKRREDPADKHRALLALGRVLAPDFELRLAADSLGGDTLAFAVLAASEWRALERDYREVVTRAFQPIEKDRNIWEMEATR
jgi:hypothetical protein